MALKFNKCCCCCGLRVGSLVLLFSDVIIRTFFVWRTQKFMSGVNVGFGQVQYLDPVQGWCFTAGVGIGYIFDALLLGGICMMKPALVKVYWILMMIYLMVTTIFMISEQVNSSEWSDINTIVVACVVICSLLYIYFLLCVRSYYGQLKEEVRRAADQGQRAEQDGSV